MEHMLDGVALLYGVWNPKRIYPYDVFQRKNYTRDKHLTNLKPLKHEIHTEARGFMRNNCRKVKIKESLKI
jgi:hypothetical protein